MTRPTFPKPTPHQWLPENLELKTWEQIEPWYQQLMDQPIDTAEDLERWLVAAGELNAAVGEEGVERHIAMTCQTDDPEREAAYLAFVRDIEPKLKPIQNAIRSRYLDSPHRPELPRDRYFVFDRALENRRSLFREANIPRETQLAELEQQYQKTIGAMTVTFRGQERTLAQMAPFLEETDRSVRQEAWELAAARRLQDRETLDDLFDQMKQLRIEIAHEAGFAELRGVCLPQPRTVRLRHRRLDPVSRGRRAGRGPADAADPGRAPAAMWAWRRSGPGTWRSTRWAGRRWSLQGRRAARRGHRDRLPRRRPRARRPVRVPARPSTCSIWPTARARPPAAIRRRSKTSGSRSSS